jgi:hypothetical protein
METYLKTLDEYLKLKNKYDTKINNKKNNIIKSNLSMQEKKEAFKNIAVPCFKCKSKDGVIFSIRNRTHIAKCASKTPCGLDIKIKQPNVVNLETKFNEFKKELELIKVKIIKIKYDILFKLIPEDEGLMIFEEYKNIFNEQNEAAESIMEQLVNNIKSTDKMKIDNSLLTDQFNAMVFEVKQNMNNFQKDNNSQYVKNAVEIYLQQILPTLKNIRDNKCKYNAIEPLQPFEPLHPLANPPSLYKCNPYDLNNLEYIVTDPKIITNIK